MYWTNLIDVSMKLYTKLHFVFKSKLILIWFWMLWKFDYSLGCLIYQEGLTCCLFETYTKTSKQCSLGWFLGPGVQPQAPNTHIPTPTTAIHNTLYCSGATPCSGRQVECAPCPHLRLHLPRSAEGQGFYRQGLWRFYMWCGVTSMVWCGWCEVVWCPDLETLLCLDKEQFT